VLRQKAVFAYQRLLSLLSFAFGLPKVEKPPMGAERGIVYSVDKILIRWDL
jgi:hypothetical protein